MSWYQGRNCPSPCKGHKSDDCDTYPCLWIKSETDWRGDFCTTVPYGKHCGPKQLEIPEEEEETGEFVPQVQGPRSPSRSPVRPQAPPPSREPSPVRAPPKQPSPVRARPPSPVQPRPPSPAALRRQEEAEAAERLIGQPGTEVKRAFGEYQAAAARGRAPGKAASRGGGRGRGSRRGGAAAAAAPGGGAVTRAQAARAAAAAAGGGNGQLYYYDGQGYDGYRHNDGYRSQRGYDGYDGYRHQRSYDGYDGYRGYDGYDGY